MSKTGPNNTNETLAHANRRKLDHLEERVETLEEQNEHLQQIIEMLQAERVKDGGFE